MAGCVFSACTIAKPIRCVYDTLPPRARRRWLLITTRWSISSFTGSERTLVAVGTVSEESMFFAVRAGAPRSTVLLRLLQIDGGTVRRVRRVGRYTAAVAGGRRPRVLVRRRPLHGRGPLGRRRCGGVRGGLGGTARGGGRWGRLLRRSRGWPAGLAGAVLAAGEAAGLGVCPAAPFPVEPLAVPPSWWVLKYCAQLGFDRAGIGDVLLVHLLQQPVVGAELFGKSVCGGLGRAGWVGHGGHNRLLPSRSGGRGPSPPASSV